MKFMVEFRLKPGSQRQIVEAFELRGPNRNPGVSFRGAWVGTRSDVIFALGESTDEALIVQACQSWDEEGAYTIYPVVDIEQF